MQNCSECWQKLQYWQNQKEVIVLHGDAITKPCHCFATFAMMLPLSMTIESLARQTFLAILAVFASFATSQDILNHAGSTS
jgi:hypothetical protein